MHPALSVVFFTSVSGAGYGLLLWLGLLRAFAPGALDAGDIVVMTLTGAVLVTLGLLASLAHLGQPQRAWRALSQWRSSWLSREGVSALVTYLPLAGSLLLAGTPDGFGVRLSGALLALGAAATVFCTARIYTSLPPIPAWRHAAVLPGYAGFALLTGGLWALLLRALHGHSAPLAALAALALLALALVLLKRRYWRDIDDQPLPLDLPTATGLNGAHGMRPFEAPNTEPGYLMREMGFVLARRHGAKLRRIAIVLVALSVPLLLLAALLPVAGGIVAIAAVLLAQAGVFVERWLFFAQARHLVSVYYRG